MVGLVRMKVVWGSDLIIGAPPRLPPAAPRRPGALRRVGARPAGIARTAGVHGVSAGQASGGGAPAGPEHRVHRGAADVWRTGPHPLRDMSKSRLPAGVSRLVGEEEIERRLAAAGVEIVHPELMSIRDKILLFATRPRGVGHGEFGVSPGLVRTARRAADTAVPRRDAEQRTPHLRQARRALGDQPASAGHDAGRAGDVSVQLELAGPGGGRWPTRCLGGKLVALL